MFVCFVTFVSKMFEPGTNMFAPHFSKANEISSGEKHMPHVVCEYGIRPGDCLLLFSRGWSSLYKCFRREMNTNLNRRSCLRERDILTTHVVFTGSLLGQGPINMSPRNVSMYSVSPSFQSLLYPTTATADNVT